MRRYLGAVALGLASVVGCSEQGVREGKEGYDARSVVLAEQRKSKNKTLGDIAGKVPPDSEFSKEGETRYKDFSAKKFSTIYEFSENDAKILKYAELSVYFEGREKASEMIGVIDLRNVGGINELASREIASGEQIVGSFIAGNAAENKDAPVFVYLTEDAVGQLRASAYLRKEVYKVFNPSLRARVVRPGSEREKYIRQENDCKIGLHDFFPEKPLGNYKVEGNKIVPRGY